ncbi:MAG: type II secretion system F family protein [Actinomycetota bacterium]|nr:type II secretion system F family protein [Actinomycetota bacterium]
MRLLGLLLVAAAVVVWPPLPAGTARRRLLGLRAAAHLGTAAPGAVAAGAVAAGTRRGRASRWLVCAAAGVCVAVASGGVGGAVAGLVVVLGGLRLLGRADAADERRRRDRRSEDLPAALDLVCVCLRAGLPVNVALAQVAGVLDGPLRDDLAMVCALSELGADARTAWSELRSDPVLAPVARALARAGSSGSAVASALAGVAEQCRGSLQERTEVAGRRVGVFVLAPLGLCFLPAFICLGVVPTILGVAGAVLG